jgi:hypothetical protein
VTPKVFISAGTVTTDAQRQAIDIVVNCLENAGLSSRRMGVNEWSHDQPLRAIRKVIAECDGIAVIAFERYSFRSGTERTKQGEKALIETRLPTVWNQIEAAIGYSSDLPLLVIAERGLWEQGLLESMYDWVVYWTNFEPEDFRSERFTGWVQSWKTAVFAHAARRQATPHSSLDITKMSVGQLIQQLTIAQFWALLSTLAGVLITVATVSYRLGASKWPWQ